MNGHYAVVIIGAALVVSDIACVVQIAVQHVIAAGNIQHAAIGQNHSVRINLAQTQRQLCTVIHGDGVGIQLGRFFRQCRTAIAVQIQMVGGHAAVVADVQ